MSLTIKQIEDGLRATGGFISQAAKQLNVTQQAISDRIKKSEYLQKVRKEIDESYLDLAESKLIKKINDNDNGSIFFYLKCKGKHRGYIERVDSNVSLGGDSNNPVKIEKSQIEFVVPKGYKKK